ncbi:heme biosynthesis protein HemY [Variovorax terrae]|uniref:Heme biosynthesis protein HemY n=1 Tax=Variovorax terrae TaxID=2923278 RepID=A0A9X1VW96_9BURK|nr:heme biosynthesis HemY N-terminal domain-containing protein [Variovorax terrae]MCJ0764338.1 heme biosynthesis protein HemY [Variovorax terrae]
MRAALWFLALFGVAVAIALFAGNNQGTITVFWPPWRVDLSLNLVLLLLAGAFVVLYAALRALSALFDLPRQAWRWRVQQKERAMHAALLDALSNLLAGRFIRSRKSAEAALVQEKSLHATGEMLANAVQVRALAHLLAAESAQSLQDRAGRDEHLKLALEHTSQREGQEAREGAQLRAARWALDDREPQTALKWLEELPQGAARRTLALRIRLKAARQARQTLEALETARLLAKHRAFSAGAAQSLVRGLATELINGAHDTAQLLRTWSTLDGAERAMPELAIQAAQRLITLGGDAAVARAWLLPVWERMVEQPDALGDHLRVKLVRALEAGRDSVDAAWLARIESAQLKNPRDANLQYLAGMACMKRQLWGKAQQLLTHAALGLQDAGLHRSAWRALAELAEQRGDMAVAAEAWKRAAQA